jgi:SAM-dependent methyltransferase
MPYYIDSPVIRKFDKAVVSIVGWIADKESCQEVSFYVGDKPIPYAPVNRPDVRDVFPGHHVLGFSIFLDLMRYVPTTTTVILKAARRTDVLMAESFAVDPELRTTCAQFTRVRAANREWCLEHIQCPHCRSPKLRKNEKDVVCSRCRARFRQDTSALNLLTPELYEQCSLKQTDNISSNNYDPQTLEMIEEVTMRGGKILDCGAGLRPDAYEAVVNFEIVDYPSTDVLGVGQALPFRDAVFDVVFSFAVLEHVSDPFECAAEITRVLKPGGKVYAKVPFLQPEHGYPNHFYNMTRQGLSNLFRGLNVEQHFVPRRGLPIWALHWMANDYAAHLPDGTRQDFLSMRIRDLLAKPPIDHLEDRIVTALSDDGNWILACTTGIILSKPTLKANKAPLKWLWYGRS